MSATLIQEIARPTGGSGSSTHTFTVPAGGVALGDHILIVMYSRISSGTPTLSSVTDARGNTYQIDTQANSSTEHISFVSCHVTTALVSGDLITATYSGNTNVWDGIAMEWSGLATSSWFDVGSSTIASGNSPTAAVTTTNADDLLIVGFGDEISTTFTPGSGFTQEGATLAGSGPTHLNVEYQEVLSTGSYQGTATFTTNPGSSGARGIVAYKVASATPPANTVAPVASGTPTVGDVLSTTNGTWTGNPTPTFTYQWQRDNAGGGSYSNIGSATASTYTLVAADQGNNVRCVVTGTNSAGNASANSNALGLVGPAYSAFPIVGTLTISSQSPNASLSFSSDPAAPFINVTLLLPNWP